MAQPTIHNVPPSPEEFNRLRAQVGWPTYPPEACRAVILNTLYHVCVRVNGELAAYGRIVGDGSTVFYIQDVIVALEYRKQGYSLRVMDHIMAYIMQHAAPKAFVGLMAAWQVEGLYEKYGFLVRPLTGKLGPGMTLPADWNEPDKGNEYKE